MAVLRKVSFLVCLVFIGSAASAQDTPPTAPPDNGIPVSPLQVIGMPIEDLLKEYPGGEKQYSLDAAGYSVVGARYAQKWFGAELPIDSDYVIAPMPPSPVTQITLRPPKGTNRTQLIATIAKYLGAPEQGPTPIGSQAQFFAQWIKDGVLFDLQDYGEYLSVYVQPAVFQDAKAFALAENTLILGRADADLNGDKMVDRALLVGSQAEQRAVFFDKLTLILKLPKPVQGVVFPLPEGLQGGYEPHVDAQYDFNGDAIPEILLSANTGGSGGIINYVLVTARGGTPSLLFDSQRDAAPKFSGQLIDGYKASLKVDGIDEVKTLDLADRKADYDQLKLYENGKLLQPTELWGDTYVLVTPVDVDNDGVFELQGIQSISGAYHADRLATITSILKWREDKWTIVKVDVVPEKAGQ